LATAQHGEINGLRLYANKALAVCLQPWMVVRLVLQILLEPWSESKCALFDNAVTLLGKDAAPLVKMLLSDEDVRVRGHVASTCFQNKHCPEWMPQIYESLVAMLNDPDKGPQGYAMMTLKEEKLLDHDWLPYKGAPGPGELRMP
jgi:hypothetical protein